MEKKMQEKLRRIRAIAFTRPRQLTLGVVLLGLVGLSLVPKYSDRTEAIPPDRCLTKPYEILAEVDHYQVIQEKTESHGHHHQEILVSVVNGICSRLNVELDGIDYPFARYIDKEIAIELNQQIWEKRIKTAGGQDSFERDFAEFAKQPAFQMSRKENPKPAEAIYMPFDKYEALKRLGVKIPANVKAANEPEFKTPKRRDSAPKRKSE